VKPIYTTVNAAAARDAFDQLAEASWRQRYPAIVQSWDNAWEACSPFLDYDLEIRRVLSTTNVIVKRELVISAASGRRVRRRHARLAPW
jgi:putative transposase